MLKSTLTRAAAILLALSALNAQAQSDAVLNLYSARHYPTDEALYAQFTKATGIRINRVDADDAGSSQGADDGRGLASARSFEARSRIGV